MTRAHINPLVAGLNAPPIPIVQNSASLYEGQHGPLIDLSQAVPGYAIHPQLKAHLIEAAGREDLLGYGLIPGEPLLRQVYAEHVSQTYGAAIDEDNIHITSGCNQAFVAAVMSVAGTGDAVLLVTPYYFNHDTTLSMLGIQTRCFEAQADNHFLPDPQVLADAITSDVRALAIVTPNNPTGAVYPPTLIRQIFDVCVLKGIWLIVDETYRDFLPDSQRAPHDLLAGSGWQDNFIGLYSFSKSFCIPGHRLGAITAGPAVISAVTKIMDNLQICAPRLAQHAVAETLEPLAGWRADNRREIDGRRQALTEVMTGLPGWEIVSIGAYFSYIRHPYQDESSISVAEKLARDKGVVTLPGAFFGDAQDAYLRFAFANADRDQLLELSARLS